MNHTPDIGWWPLALITLAFASALYFREACAFWSRNKRTKPKAPMNKLKLLLLLCVLCASVLNTRATDICHIAYSHGQNGQPGGLGIYSCEPIPNHEYWWWAVSSIAECVIRPGIASTNYNPNYALFLGLPMNQTQQFLQLLDLTAKPEDKAAFTARARAGKGQLIPAIWITNSNFAPTLKQ